jgi:hypothetical protein
MYSELFKDGSDSLKAFVAFGDVAQTHSSVSGTFYPYKMKKALAITQN